MNYQTSAEAHPSSEKIADMVDYVSGDLRTITGSGFAATDEDLDSYRAAADGCELSQFHTFSFSKEWSPDEIADRVHDATRDARSGEVLIGVHEGVSGNAHAHVAEFGSRDEVEMDVSDIVDYRESVCDRFAGESIGAEA